MSGLTLTWSDETSRLMVPIYDLIDVIDGIQATLRVDALAEAVHGNHHMAYVEGTLDGIDIISGWLKDEAAQA